jgi:formylglycine-generating enzyme required for sulfatase activity
MKTKGISVDTIIALIALIVAICILLFGENIYQQITGQSIFSVSGITATAPSGLATTAIPSPIDESTSISTPRDLPIEITDTYGVSMRLVLAGEFTMGDNSSYENERPAHTVFLEDYYIDKYEVTNASYKACVQSGICKDTEVYSPKNTIYLDDTAYENYPVIAIDWNSAWIYCNWRGIRLPTEAEWEKAARGTDRRVYPWGNSINNARANYDSNVGEITPVGSYESGVSIYGVYDMAGNVWEWVNSQYKDYPYDSKDGRENLNPSGIHVLRGCDYSQPADFVRSSNRFPLAPPDLLVYTGFRCARSP